MPYDAARDPWHGVAVSPTGLGRRGAAVTPSDAADLARYARIRVWAPAELADAAIAILPLDAADDAPITLPVPVGQASVLPYLVRRVLATGTTAGLVIHTIG
ncbi:spike base protein, RCAP_Rcc01079 family [Ancylobacter terrae]|uniref:spike base protein, RCAP_Rcc01079 family n=1 Tax=Ancylobacter sp. sgz301288 TaxID=3342077 RepID=UPI003858BE17